MLPLAIKTISRILMVIILLMIMILFSCHFKDNENSQRKLSLPRKVIIFPDTVGTTNMHIDTALKRISSGLGLVNIQNGFYSFYLRLWYSSLDTVHVVSIQQTKHQKTGQIISYFSEVNENRDSSWIIIYRDDKGLQPQSGWDSLYMEFNRNKIQFLPDIDSITHRHHQFTGGTAYIFEIATAGKYRNYTYHSPAVVQDELKHELWQVNNVVTFLEFFSRQFGLPPLERFEQDIPGK